MIKRAVVPTHSKSVKRRYSDHVENQFLDFDSKTGLLLPFLLLEACGLRLAAPREGNGRGSCSPPFVLLVTNTNPNQLTEGQDRPGKQGTLLLWPLTLRTLTIADACFSPLPRFPSLRSAVLQPPLVAFPHWPTAGIATLLVGPLV